jgi:hypothetical protein
MTSAPCCSCITTLTFCKENTTGEMSHTKSCKHNTGLLCYEKNMSKISLVTERKLPRNTCSTCKYQIPANEIKTKTTMHQNLTNLSPLEYEFTRFWDFSVQLINLLFSLISRVNLSIVYSNFSWRREWFRGASGCSYYVSQCNKSIRYRVLYILHVLMLLYWCIIYITLHLQHVDVRVFQFGQEWVH